MFLLVSCNSGGGSSSKDKDKKDTPDPCDGPVLCLTENWGNQYAIFYDHNNAACVLVSNGTIFACAFNVINQNNEIATLALGGDATKCRFSKFNEGAIDYNLDGTLDEALSNVVGNLAICNEELTIQGLKFTLNEILWTISDITAYFDGMASLTQNNLHTEVSVAEQDITDIKNKINMVKELLEVDP